MPKPETKDTTCRVVTVCLNGVQDKEAQPRVEKTLKIMDAAAGIGPDIICLPECYCGGEAEPLPGPSTKPIGKWAADNNINVICPLRTNEDGRKFNSAVIYNRKGEMVGVYHKIHLTEGALEATSLGNDGCPGPLDPPVFEVDGVTFGCQICFDVNWPADWRRLKEKGARIIFWPSAFPAKRRLAAYAWQHEIFTVSATLDRACHIYDISGDILASTGMFRQWAWADLNLGKRLFEIDYQTDKARAIQAKYGDKVEVTWFHDEDWWTLASNLPDISTADLIAEYELTPLVDYIPRAEKANDVARAEKLGDTK